MFKDIEKEIREEKKKQEINLKITNGILKMLDEIKDERFFDSREEVISSLVRESHSEWRKNNTGISIY